MKRKALVALLLCVMGLTALGIGNAEAANAWYGCSIKQVGTNDSLYMVMASDTAATPAFTNEWFMLDKSQGAEKNMLATLLTAISGGNYVTMYISAPTTYSTVYSVMIMK